MKNWFRKGILYGTALATLAGCSIDSKSVNPEENRVNTVEEASNRILRQTRNNPELETRVNNVLGRMNSKSRSAEKTAQSEIRNFSYGEFTGDLDLDHDVDFDDFFLLADKFGIDYDYNHFFKLADNFGENVNSIAEVIGIEISNGNEVNVGDEVVFNGVVRDIENDPLNYKWFVGSEPAEVNGSELRRIFNEAGEYPVALRVSDSFGAQSNEFSKTINVIYSGPVLSLPNSLRFSQWIAGENTGNILRLNLDDYVSDPNFSDSELIWSVTAEDKVFRHDKDNTAPFGQQLGWLVDYYTANPLHLILDGRNLTIDPVANYNASDHGTRYVDFTVTNPNGSKISKRIAVDVRRNDDFDGREGYDDVPTLAGWNEPPVGAYIWTGNIREHGDSKDPRLWTGRQTNQEEIDNFRKVFEKFHEVSDYFQPLDVIETDNPSDIYDENAGFPLVVGQIIGYVDRNVPGEGGAGLNYIKNNGYWGFNSCRVMIDPVSTLRTYAHEIGHCYGMHHPRDEPEESYNRTLFTQGTTLTEPSAKDKAVINSFYELLKYGAVFVKN